MAAPPYAYHTKHLPPPDPPDYTERVRPPPPTMSSPWNPPSYHQGLEDNQKSLLLFIGIYAAVILTLDMVFCFSTYPDFQDDKRFEHDPFMVMMFMATSCIFNILVIGIRLASNLGDKDVPWWMQTLSGCMALAMTGVWIWSIVILDSKDGELLEQDYESIYKLLLASACLSGISLVLVVLGLCCFCLIWFNE